MSATGPELLRRLLDEQGPALVLYARQWCGTPEDVVQDALVQLMREPKLPDNLVGWLYRVVRNAAISAGRSQTRRTRHEAAAAAQTAAWFTSGLDDVLDAAAVTASLATLPLDQREPIVLRLWGGLSFDEIAELTQTSTSTAQRRYIAGLTTLRERHLQCMTPKTEKK